MYMTNKKTGQSFLVAGLFLLAVSSYLLTKHQSDFISGIGYGVSIGFIILGIIKLKRD